MLIHASHELPLHVTKVSVYPTMISVNGPLTENISNTPSMALLQHQILATQLPTTAP